MKSVSRSLKRGGQFIPVMQRILAKLEKSGDCILWTGCVNEYGYAKTSIGRKHLYAHRVVYEERHGKIPHGLVIDHLCRNRRCLSVDHMEAVTRKVNTLRGESFSAVNAKKTHCPSGHAYGKPEGGRRICRTCYPRKT